MNDTTDPSARPAVPQIDGITDLVQVGRGGFGTVFRGHQSDIDRTVAIKLLNGAAHDAEAHRRFRREVTAMGAISHHPNVVPVYAIGTAGDGRPFLVMPYLPGGTLGDRLGRLGWAEMVDLGSKMAGALQAAHDVGVLHRDVKPANILWSAWNEPQLADFGIARLHDATRTAPGMVVASLTWAAPEVLEGKPASPASDVFSLAASLHAAITGRSPHAPKPDEPMATTVARIVSQPAPDLTAFGVPRAVNDVIAEALAKDPAHRPPGARVFGDALVAAAAAETSSGRAPVPVPAVEPVGAVEALSAVDLARTAEPMTPVAPVLAAHPESHTPGTDRSARALPLAPTVIARSPVANDHDRAIAGGPRGSRRRPQRWRRIGPAILGGFLLLVLAGLLVRQLVDNPSPKRGSASSGSTSSSVPRTTGSTPTVGSGGSAPRSNDPSTATGSTTLAPTSTTASPGVPSRITSPTSGSSPTAPPPTISARGGAASGAPEGPATLTAYYDQLARNAYASTWTELTPAYQRRIGGYGAYTRFWRTYDRVDLSNVRADGDLAATATVRYHQPNGATVRETGRFRFVRLASGRLAIDDFRVSTRS